MELAIPHMVLLISTQGFGELESCGGVELSQCDAIKENRYYRAIAQPQEPGCAIRL